MKNLRLMIISINILLLMACTNKDNNYNNVEKLSSSKLLNCTVSDFDTLIVIPNVCSGVGFFQIEDSTLLYFDEMFCTVSAFNIDGKFEYQKLGLGKGPNEIGAINGYYRSGQDRYVYQGWVFYVFDENWNKKSTFLIDWNHKHSEEELLHHPSFSYTELYNINFFNNNIISNKDELCLKLEFDHLKMNKFNSKEHYTQAALIGVMNPKSGFIEKLKGSYPPIFLEQQFIPQFSHFYYDEFNNGDYLLSFEADSLIYICDSDFKPKKSFGLAGKMNDTAYKKFKSYEAYMKGFSEERETKGHYTDITYFQSNDILFRTYRTGKDNNNGDGESRMQIYQAYNLLADISVPNSFKVMGYIAPYFYADGYHYDTENGSKIGLYKFKIDELQ